MYVAQTYASGCNLQLGHGVLRKPGHNGRQLYMSGCILSGARYSSLKMLCVLAPTFRVQWSHNREHSRSNICSCILCARHSLCIHRRVKFVCLAADPDEHRNNAPVPDQRPARPEAPLGQILPLEKSPFDASYSYTSRYTVLAIPCRATF